MSENGNGKNGNGTWTRWTMGIIITTLLTVGGILAASQRTRDAQQDSRIEKVETKCDALASMQTDISWIKKYLETKQK